MDRKIHLTLFVIGFITMIAQIIVMRELLVIFYGNELTIGITLSVWLFATGLGSGVLGRQVFRLKQPVRYLGIAVFCYAILALAAILLIRTTPRILDWSYGEIIGIIPILATSLVTVTPVCLMGGILFALGYRCYQRLDSEPVQAVSRAYLLESAGAAVSGFITSQLLVRLFNHLVLMGWLIFIASAVLFWLTFRPARKRFWHIPAILALVSINLLMVLNMSKLEIRSRQLLWKNARLVHSQESIYGHIAIIRHENTVSFYENGLLLFTHPDPMATEEAVHFAMLQHPKPQSVLLVGGGVNGSLREILKYASVSHVDYVELDPKIIQLAKQYLPDSIRADLSHPHVRVNHIDGRRFIRISQNYYDVVLINLTDPYNAMINRFYTREFFREAAAKLRPNGIIGFRITSSENFISTEQAELLACLTQTVASSFLEHIVIPGDMNYIIGCKSPQQLLLNADSLICRLRERQIHTTFLREYYLPFRITPERVNYLTEQIQAARQARINQDLAPVGYYYNMVLWSTYFADASRALFKRLMSWGIKPYLAMLFGLMVILMLWIFSRRYDQLRFRSLILLSVAGVGLTEISLEFVIILAFQVFWGYAYTELGLIIACYMVGLALGSYHSKRYLERNSRPLRRFIGFQLLMMVFPLLLAFFFAAIQHSSLMNGSLLLRMIFYTTAFLAGYIGGHQFPLACALLAQRSDDKVAIGSMVYGIDLVGSCVGALAMSAILVPILGLYSICTGLALLNGIILASLLLNLRKGGLSPGAS